MNKVKSKEGNYAVPGKNLVVSTNGSQEEPNFRLPKNPKALRIIPLGGLGEFGKNMQMLESGDDIIIIDCGLMFPHQEMLGVDFVIPDIRYLEQNKEKIKGIIFTHGHEDHIGGTPYIWPRLGCPLWATALTRGLLEVKFQEFGVTGVPINTITPGDTLKLGNFTVETFPMSHSMPGDIGLIIRTSLGTLVHIADFKFDRRGDSQNMISLLQRIGATGVLALFMDSTNVEEEGKAISEVVVEEAIDSIFGRTRGRILVTSFASAIPRIQSVINACQKHRRRLAISGRTMERNVEMTKRLGYLKVPQGILINIRKIHRLPDDQVAIMCTGSQGEEFSALSRMAGGEHQQITIKPGDTIVISGSVIPGNERSVADTVNNLFRQGADVIYGGEGADIHTSGHAKREDLKMVLKIVKPKYFMPIHGEYRHLVLHAKLAQEMGVNPANIFVLENGQVLDITKNEALILKMRVPSGYVLVDGLGVGDVGNIVLRDRQAMAKEGILVAIMTIDHDTSKLITSPDIISRGFIYMREQEELVFKIRQEVKRLLAKYNEEHHGDLNMIKAKIRDDIGEFIFREIQRRPMVIPVIIQV